MHIVTTLLASLILTTLKIMFYEKTQEKMSQYYVTACHLI